jgi:hypothetical protein
MSHRRRSRGSLALADREDREKLAVEMHAGLLERTF